MAVESPRYTVVHKEGRFEIREYETYVLAEVEVDADFAGALQKGFRILAGYIFGGNTAKSRIAMTAPVTEQPLAGEKIDMTAPVLCSTLQEGRQYRIGFSMPSRYSLDNLPAPSDKTILFRKVPERKVAVLRFSGNLNAKLAMRKGKEFKAWLDEHRYSQKENLMFAQYDPPWIPGFFRRNEVLAEIAN